jgi:hypothetical protein
MTTKPEDLKSECCLAPMTIGGDDREGTHYFVCTKCGKACNTTIRKMEITKEPEVAQDRQKELDNFMEAVRLVQQWFKDEEMEISDGLTGRLAARVNKLRKKWTSEARKSTDTNVASKAEAQASEENGVGLKDWKEQYPLSTFSGRTRKELEEFIDSLLAAERRKVREETIGIEERIPKYGVSGGWEVYLGFDKSINLTKLIDIVEPLIKKQRDFEGDLLNYSEKVKGSDLQLCPFPNEEVSPYRLSELAAINGGLLRILEGLYFIKTGKTTKQVIDNLTSAEEEQADE